MDSAACIVDAFWTVASTCPTASPSWKSSFSWKVRMSRKAICFISLKGSRFRRRLTYRRQRSRRPRRNSRTPTFPSGTPSSGGTAPAIPVGRPRRRPPRAKRGGALQRALEHSEFSLLRLELTDRRGDLRRREDRRRQLIKQRLEYVVVASVDQQVLALPH